MFSAPNVLAMSTLIKRALQMIWITHKIIEIESENYSTRSEK